ncbi:uncharacterized protein LOC129286300 [Prosopis cineraria]|uniref:uncharacterized protein LOC129286300 n=1 Tax=Prosopis cineraria TaxID=364024 RepID=UPI00240F984D|nr:uncharacterized protein LOC129286300 [Prosopis cineraria]
MEKKRKEMSEETIKLEENRYVTPNTTICNGILRSKRGQRPAHYMLRINSYSKLAVTKLESYESDVFEAGGFNWRMVVYLRGKNQVRDQHISMYLAIANVRNSMLFEKSLSISSFLFTIKYVINVENELKRFHAGKTQWGFDELLPMDTFKDVANGYLVDDSCVFGAEVFVVQCSGNWECLTTLDNKFKDSYTWKLSKYSQIVEEFCESEAFSIKGKTWKPRVYPRGDRSPKNEFLSMFLVLNEDESLVARKKWFAEYTLRLKNQSVPSRTRELNVAAWLSQRTNTWGFSQFMSLKDLNEDTLIIECQITCLSEVEHFKQ